MSYLNRRPLPVAVLLAVAALVVVVLTRPQPPPPVEPTRPVATPTRYVVVDPTRPVSEAIAYPARRSFYISSQMGNDANAGTSTAAPWKTLAKANEQDFAPGDVVNLMRGSDWTGGLVINSSGQAGSPIVFRAYGDGATPIVRGPIGKGVGIRVNGQYVIIDGLLVRDAQGAGIYLASTAQHSIVRNSEITAAGTGVQVEGPFNLITHNYAHDLKMVVNTPGGQDDWGAIGVLLSAPDSEVSYNRFERCKAPSYDFEVDGAAVELYGIVDRSSIHHNFGRDNAGFIEAGGGSARYNIVAFNIVVDDGRFVGFHLDGVDGTGVDHFEITNNTIVDTRPDGNWAAIYFMEGKPKINMLTVRNNIFYLNNYQTVVSHPTFVHDHNLFYLLQPTTALGFSPGDGDIVADPRFVDLAGGDYHLTEGSPAIDAGSEPQYSSDFDGHPVPSGSGPDIGALEWVGR